MKQRRMMIENIHFITLKNSILFVFTLSLQVSLGQSAHLSGQVVNQADEKPVIGATVALKNADGSLVKGTLTDEEGKFHLKGLIRQVYSLVITHIRHEDFSQSLNLDSDNIDLGKVFLMESSTQLQEVVISEMGTRILENAGSRVIEVGDETVARGGTAINALQALPSVNVDQFGEFQLRGGANLQVLINGRPALIRSNDALSQVQSGSIESVELVTTPSAINYPDRPNGTINIVQKRSEKMGFSGTASYQHGTLGNHTAGVYGLYNFDKLRLIGELLSTKTTRQVVSSADRIIQRPSGTLYRVSDVDEDNAHITNVAKLGLEIPFSDKSVFYVEGKLYDRDLNRTTMTKFVQWEENSVDLKDYEVDTRSRTDDNTAWELNWDFKHRFGDKSGFTLIGFHTFWDGELGNELIGVETNDQYLRNEGDTLLKGVFLQDAYDLNRNDLSLHYDHQLTNKMKIVIGGQYRDLNRKSDVRSMNRDDYQNSSQNNGQLNVVASFLKSPALRTMVGAPPSTEDDQMEDVVTGISQQGSRPPRFPEFDSTYRINVNRSIITGFSEFSFQNKRWKAQVGLRVESVLRDIEYQYPNSTDVYELDQFNWLPSLLGSYRLGKENRLLLSFGRRVFRPDVSMMLEYYDYRNFGQAFTGNSNIRPSISDQYELKHIWRIKKVQINTALYHRFEHDIFFDARIVQEIDGNEVTVGRFTNVGDQKITGIEFNLQISLPEWYRGRFGVNLYQKESIPLDDPNGNGTFELPNDFDGEVVKLNHNSVFRLRSGTILQLFAYWSSTERSFGTTNGRYLTTNLSATQQLLKKKLSVTVEVWNFFRRYEWETSRERPDYIERINNTYRNPKSNFSLNYTF